MGYLDFFSCSNYGKGGGAHWLGLGEESQWWWQWLQKKRREGATVDDNRRR